MFDFLNICSPFYAPPADKGENNNPEVDSVEPYYLVYGEQVDEPELFERIKLSTKEIYCTVATQDAGFGENNDTLSPSAGDLSEIKGARLGEDSNTGTTYACTACAYADGWARLTFKAERVIYTYETGRGWSVKELGKNEYGIPVVSELNDGSAFTVKDGEWGVGTPDGGSIDADATPEDAGKLLGVKDDGSIGLIDAVYGVGGNDLLIGPLALGENYNEDESYYWVEVPEFNEINFEFDRSYSIGMQFIVDIEEPPVYLDFTLVQGPGDEKYLDSKGSEFAYFKYIPAPSDSGYVGWILVFETEDEIAEGDSVNIYLPAYIQRRIPVKYIDGIETLISSEGYKLVAAGHAVVTNTEAASFQPGMSTVQVTYSSQTPLLTWFIDEDNIEAIVDPNSLFEVFGTAIRSGADLIVMFDPGNMHTASFPTTLYATVCNMGSEATETFDIGDITIEVPMHLFAKVNPISSSDDSSSNEPGGEPAPEPNPNPFPGQLDDGKH